MGGASLEREREQIHATIHDRMTVSAGIEVARAPSLAPADEGTGVSYDWHSCSARHFN